MKDVGEKRYKILISYFLIYVVWGSTYYFIGIALRDIPAFLLGGISFMMAGLMLFLFCLYQREKVFNRRPILKSAISGIVLLFIDMAVIMLAQRYVSSSLVAIFSSSTAIWIIALDFHSWKKNLGSGMAILGIISGFAGVSMLYIEQHLSQNAQISERGIIILILGCISWALRTLFTKYADGKEEHKDGFAGSAWQMLIASIAFFVVGLVRGEACALVPSSISMSSWYSLAFLVIFGSILSYSAYIWLLKVRPAAEVATHAYVNPVIAILIGVLIGNETVSLIQLLSLFLILLSIYLTSLKSKRTAHDG